MHITLKLMKKTILYLFIWLSIGSCSKGISSSEYAKSMLAGKTWFLDYSIQNDQIKSFIGKSTYFISFDTDGTTKDADGLFGDFVIEEENQILSLHIKAITQTYVKANYTYRIENISSDNLMVSYILEGHTIKKIFSTTH